MGLLFVFFFKQNTAYEMRISDWSSDVCSSDLPLIDAALSLRRETLGPDNPATLDTANNLAGLYRKTGRAAEAEALLYHVLEVRRRIHGELHPLTLSALNNLGATRFARGAAKGADRKSTRLNSSH